MRIAIVVAALVALRASALAAPSAEALFDEGQAAYNHGDYARAIDRWQESYRLSKEPALLFNVAQAYRLAGDCVHALSTYEWFVAVDPTSAQRALADDFVRELEPKCGASTQPPRVERPSTRPGRTLEVAGIVTAGGGVALVVTGLLFGRHAGALGDDVSRACSQTCDWAAQKDEDARGRRYATAGYVLDAVGVAAIAAGAFTYYLGDREDRVAVVPQPDERGAVVTWSGTW